MGRQKPASVKNGRDAGSPEPYDPQVHRASTVSKATTTISSFSGTTANENETEMFSGAGANVVPSSISSFHHHHGSKSIRSPSSIASGGSDRPVREEFVLDEPFEEEAVALDRVKTGASDLTERANFRFFTTDEIERAKGVSSLRRTATNHENVAVPIDYDTNWNTFEDDYASDAVTDSGDTDTENEQLVHSSSDHSYGSVQEDGRPGSHDLGHDRGYRERRMTYDAEDELVREQESKDRFSGRDQRTSPDEHDKLFGERFPASNQYQRFYLAEEDLVIGIAGYNIIRSRQLLYYAFCCLTLGLGYLILRWLPRYKLQFFAEDTPLAKAVEVVVEDEYGVLDIIPVQRLWYNKKLSTFMPVDNLEEKEAQGDGQQGGSGSGSGSGGDTPSIDDIDPFVPVLVYFEYRYMKFFYDPRDDLFKLSNNWVDERWCHYPDIKDGIAEETYKSRYEIFGPNLIKIKEKSIFQLLRDEILHPFYMFQVFSILLWLADNYYYYAFCIFIISLFSVGESLLETRTNMKRMRELAMFKCTVRVWRNNFWKEIASEDLVPGDVYEVSDPSLSVFPCDSLLLDGDCIVNESMLTGESVPVSKVPIAADTVKFIKEELNANKFSPRFSKSFLYNGTKIVRCRYGSNGAQPATALVVKSGFNTTKGALVRSMLFPKPVGFKFYEDSFKYIGVMGLVAGIGFIFSIANFIKLGVDTRTIILRALDIVTIVVPPALPATLTIGTSFALNRLRAKNIFCIAPTRLNIGGKLDVTCFDKTGTLTEEGLDVMGVHVSQPKSQKKGKGNEFTPIFDTSNAMLKTANLDNAKSLFATMLTCHSLKLIEDNLTGDPLDEKMFEFVGCELAEDPQSDADLEKFISTHKLPPGANPILFRATPSTPAQIPQDRIIYQLQEYEFISQLRRMSVICQFSDTPDEFSVYVKGAPEVMRDICKPETIPSNFGDLLHQYTHSGFRVIACASKKIKNVSQEQNNLRYIGDIPRDEIESELEFVGFIIFENRLKKGTTQALKELREAHLRTVMCTGDNVLTAVSVAKECHLVDPLSKVYIASFDYETIQEIEEQATVSSTPPIVWTEVDNPEEQLDPVTLAPLSINADDNYSVAITGDVFKYILTELSDMEYFIEKMLMRGAIFARMSPDEKHELVNRLKALDYTVGFCGDGANDCGALKAADVGISLSEAEASVAAPFTSRIFEISCVLDVIKEGRASLVTSFSCFQYMSLYSAIQFVSVSILYKEGVNLGDFQFLFIDLFLIIPIAVFMSWSKPYPVLCKKRPTANLISPKILIPLLGSIFVELCFQLSAWREGKHPSADWYITPVPGNDEEVKCTDNTIVFLFANFQYIFAALMLTVGPPYREPAIKNQPFILTIIATVAMSIVLMAIDPASSFGDLMDLTWFPTDIKVKLLVGAVVNYIVLEIGDKYVFLRLAKLYKRLLGKKASKKRFKNLKREFKRLNEA